MASGEQPAAPESTTPSPDLDHAPYHFQLAASLPLRLDPICRMRGFHPCTRDEKPAQTPRVSPARSSSQALLRANMSSRIPPQPGPFPVTGHFLPRRSTPQLTAPLGSVQSSVSPPPVASLWLSASTRRVVEALLEISSSARSVHYSSPQSPHKARCAGFRDGGICRCQAHSALRRCFAVSADQWRHLHMSPRSVEGKRER